MASRRGVLALTAAALVSPVSLARAAPVAVHSYRVGTTRALGNAPHQAGFGMPTNLHSQNQHWRELYTEWNYAG